MRRCVHVVESHESRTCIYDSASMAEHSMWMTNDCITLTVLVNIFSVVFLVVPVFAAGGFAQTPGFFERIFIWSGLMVSGAGKILLTF